MTVTIVAAMTAGAPASSGEKPTSQSAYAKALAIKQSVDEIRFRILEARRSDPAADVSGDEAQLEAARQALKAADEEILAARRREGLPVEGLVGILPDSLPPVRMRK